MSIEHISDISENVVRIGNRIYEVRIDPDSIVDISDLPDFGELDEDFANAYLRLIAKVGPTDNLLDDFGLEAFA